MLRQVQQKQDAMHADVGDIKTDLAVLKLKQDQQATSHSVCRTDCAGHRTGFTNSIKALQTQQAAQGATIQGGLSRSRGWKDIALVSVATSGFVFTLLKIWQTLFPNGGA